MEYSETMQKIIEKEETAYDVLKEKYLSSRQEVRNKDGIWKVNVNDLNLKVQLDNSELISLIKYFYLSKYEQVTYINIPFTEGKIFYKPVNCCYWIYANISPNNDQNTVTITQNKKLGNILLAATIISLILFSIITPILTSH